jgi:hypothetical protein
LTNMLGSVDFAGSSTCAGMDGSCSQDRPRFEAPAPAWESLARPGLGNEFGVPGLPVWPGHVLERWFTGVITNFLRNLRDGTDPSSRRARSCSSTSEGPPRMLRAGCRDEAVFSPRQHAAHQVRELRALVWHISTWASKSLAMDGTQAAAGGRATLEGASVKIAMHCVVHPEQNRPGSEGRRRRAPEPGSHDLGCYRARVNGPTSAVAAIEVSGSPSRGGSDRGSDAA